MSNDRARKGWSIAAAGAAAMFYSMMTRFLEPGVVIYDVMFVGMVTLYVSPFLPVFYTVVHERRRLKEAVDLRTQSWAFLLGDVGLAVGLSFGIIAHQSLPNEGFWTSWVWTLLCLVVGLAAGIAFNVWDRGNYAKVGALAHANAPSKVIHDLMVYPYLVSMLLYVGGPLVPTLFSGTTHHGTWVLLGTVVLWAVFSIRDNVMGMDPRKLHPPYEWR